MPLDRIQPVGVLGRLVSTQVSPIVDLGYAQYQGTVNTANNVTHFLGIRYAAPPSGDLRFRAPQPPANMSGVQQATIQPNECFQGSTGRSPTNPLKGRATQVIETEDCLFLNVYYPSNEVGGPLNNLPTLVWIHGGGYVSGAMSAYNGEDIIRQSDSGVVVVTIQYRLGLFGKLLLHPGSGDTLTGYIRVAGSAVKKNGALNAGLRKVLRFALRWISKFGGDPSKVTIWGISAGAGSVLQQVIAHDGRTEPQLFRAAITSSSFLPSQYRFDDPIPEFLFSEVLAQTNCATATNSMSCLRAVDATTLEAVNTNITTSAFFGTFVFVPVVDGTFITQRPTLSLLEGKVNGEAVLSVTNTFEGTGFVDQSVSVTASNYSLELFPRFGGLQALSVRALYSGLGTDLFQVNAVQGESIFICPTYYLLNAFHGRAFKGEFAIPPGFHGMDQAYYFPGDSPPPFNNAAFIDAFAQSFTSFIINLDPNIKVDPTTITPHWNTFDIAHTEMLFNQTAVDGLPVVHAIETSDALLERCLFWDSVGSLTVQ
ncbi:Alpha/Beta hydrolase protein [Mycena albidolilacea]|uniref:Carboxylic ester hydrolase n=1 Tax=Mycena albidolilacea TaxID=1033008 RepID=A0AAD6Z4U6_9AGAR|nr:Alpha/Beta hydrolase protein [Mycena albidolilacea]